MIIPEKATYMWAKQEDNGLVLQETSPILFEFNQVACQIWELVDGKRTVEEITKAVYTLYPNQPKAEISKDIEDFLKALEENQLLTFKTVNESGEKAK